MTGRCIHIRIGLFKVALRQNLIFHEFRSRSIHNNTPYIYYVRPLNANATQYSPESVSSSLFHILLWILLSYHISAIFSMVLPL